MRSLIYKLRRLLIMEVWHLEAKRPLPGVMTSARKLHKTQVQVLLFASWCLSPLEFCVASLP